MEKEGAMRAGQVMGLWVFPPLAFRLFSAAFGVVILLHTVEP